jgi:hypothetical protein
MALIDKGRRFVPYLKTHPETHRNILTIGGHDQAIPRLSEVELEALLDFACQAPQSYPYI